ncbi:2-amino-3-carboxymuconate-6-semialdehyde decarboxylase [Parelaphostrongylus tenuis]|uniref:2-amino-3-carboxymuconate-6-semialdehyde decarboxylase n=1 Tax=Parelaphostrongylus tenuis TaxID=148309 RepID=A0AAD5RER5_PARTN|nr:2-amino-3-carboxymuconate-6-semialdehyde decarboxylase [Parelaphostrongylus tenuis]
MGGLTALRKAKLPDLTIAFGKNNFAQAQISTFCGWLAQLQEVRRCAALGVRGFEIGSHVGEKSLDHADFWPLYKECEDLGLVLFVHPWDMHSWDGRLSKYWMPWLVGMPSETAQAICSVLMGNVLLRFPRLRFCFAHGGGSYPMIAGRVAHGYKVRPDLCATDCLTSPSVLQHSIWADSLVHDPTALHLLINVVGKDKIVLGTDYPFPLGELEVGKVIEDYELFSGNEKDQLLWSNAIELFRLDENSLFRPITLNFSSIMSLIFILTFIEALMG